MAHVIWIPEGGTAVGDRSDFELVACVEANDTLYVIVANVNPPRSQRPEMVRVEILAEGAGALAWQGHTGVGNKKGDLLVASFSPPGPETSALTVNVEIDDRHGLSVRAARQVAQT